MQNRQVNNNESDSEGHKDHPEQQDKRQESYEGSNY
jgi:hypothetical protein